MSGTLDLERRLATWLEQDGPADVPAAAVEAALAQARTIRQQRAWLTRTWWDRRPLAAAPARVEAGAIEPAERIPTFPVGRAPLRPAWALLLLAGLLVALVGGTLLVGSQTQRRLPAVVPPVGQVFECPPGSTPDRPGPVDQARPDMGAAIAFDRHAGRLVAVGVSDFVRRIVETWTFDVCTNTWTRMHPNREPPLFVDGRLVYDVDSDVTLLISFLKVWAYDLEANTWTERPSTPAGYTLLGYDPLSGLVVAASGDVTDPSVPMELWYYDVETDTWTPIHQANGPAAWGMHAYDASVDRMVVYTFGGDEGREPETWLLDLRTGRWSRSAADTPDVPWMMGAWASVAYDEAAGRTVVISRQTAMVVPYRYRLAAYDATGDRWEILTEAGPGEEWWPLDMVYDPVNRRLVGGLGGEGAVVAFDLATREWTVLLEPTEGQPPP
jgi:hypothetical protein